MTQLRKHHRIEIAALSSAVMFTRIDSDAACTLTKHRLSDFKQKARGKDEKYTSNGTDALSPYRQRAHVQPGADSCGKLAILRIESE
jgi:hypothetical protein